MSRIETDEMTLMAVLWVIVAPVVVPFIQVTLMAHGIRVKFG
jgi:hypothetical protein